jgi:hypothetical protein
MAERAAAAIAGNAGAVGLDHIILLRGHVIYPVHMPSRRPSYSELADCDRLARMILNAEKGATAHKSGKNRRKSGGKWLWTMQDRQVLPFRWLA